MDEGNGALVRVQAEPEAVWEAAFYLEEGDAITTWAFWVQNMSWCAAGSDSSLSSSHLMCQHGGTQAGEVTGSGDSGLAWAGSQTPGQSVCTARISSWCVLCVISTPSYIRNWLSPLMRRENFKGGICL